MRAVTALVAGVVFAIGLLVSGMTIPAKVTGFLDVTRDWDPTLAFVMAGAIAVFAPVVRLARGRSAPLFSERFHWPSLRAIDLRLVLGAAIFGAGWGISGYCPGPALVSAASGTGVLVFLATMLAGDAIAKRT